jgi:hypothetical protein
VGGDITGKAMVPIIRRRDQWDTTMFGQHVVLKTEAEVAGSARLRGQMILLGWTNSSPWNTFRELPENELAKRVDELVARSPAPHARSSTSTPRRTAADSTKRRAWTKISA